MVNSNKILMFLCFVYLSCGTTGYEPLQLIRQDYSGQEIRLEGYYYFKEVVPMGPGTSILFLYKNGVVYNFGVVPDTSLSKVDAFIKTIPHSSTDKPYAWGVFQVNDNKVKIEIWDIVSGGKNTTTLREGKILNDSTIQICLFNRPNEFYRFRKFFPKPDSTNRFVE